MVGRTAHEGNRAREDGVGAETGRAAGRRRGTTVRSPSPLGARPAWNVERLVDVGALLLAGLLVVADAVDARGVVRTLARSD